MFEMCKTNANALGGDRSLEGWPPSRSIDREYQRDKGLWSTKSGLNSGRYASRGTARDFHGLRSKSC